MLASRVGKLEPETPIARFNEVLIRMLKFDQVLLNMLKHCLNNIFLVELTLKRIASFMFFQLQTKTNEW